MSPSRTTPDSAPLGTEWRGRLDPLLLRIAEYLATRRSRDEIDPIDIPPDLLPHLFVLEAEQGALPDTARLRVRLTGTSLDIAFGRSVKGCFMDDFLHGSHSASVMAGFRRCQVANEAIWMRQVVRISQRAPRYVEGVAFPVAPNLIYGGMRFGELSNRSAESTFEIQVLIPSAPA